MTSLGQSKDDYLNLADFQQVKDQKYILAVIWEVLRYRPTSAMGLPRSVPKGGLTVCGKQFEEGTVLSVPSFSIHHNPAVYPDPEVFKPERFLGKPPADKEFIPFSYGPRACVGRNVAMMELQTVLANLLYRFEFTRVEGNEVETELREGFLVKPVKLLVTMKKRE